MVKYQNISKLTCGWIRFLADNAQSVVGWSHKLLAARKEMLCLEGHNGRFSFFVLKLDQLDLTGLKQELLPRRGLL